MERIIEKQFNKLGLSKTRLPTDLDDWKQFLDLVEALFEENQRNEYLLLRALRICTEELNEYQVSSGIVSEGKNDPIAGNPEIQSDLLKKEQDLHQLIQKQTTLADQLMAEVESAKKLKSQFLSNVTHEIRSPMNAVLGMASLLKQTGLNFEQDEYVESIINSGKHLLAMINDMIDLSRIESGLIQIEKSEFSPLDTIEGTVKEYLPAALEKEIRLDLRVELDVPALLKGDGHRMQRMWGKLIENAIKFTEKGFVTVNLSAEAAGEGVVKLTTTVRDSGVGIRSEEVESLFDAFVQGDNTETRAHGGNGIGLTLSKRFAQLMGGDLRFKRLEGKGSEFELSCLVGMCSDAGSVYDLEPMQMTMKTRVLMVDPSPFCRGRYEDILNFWKVPHEIFDDLESMESFLSENEAALLIVHVDALGGSQSRSEMIVRKCSEKSIRVAFLSPSKDFKGSFVQGQGVEVLEEPVDLRYLNRLIRESSMMGLSQNQNDSTVANDIMGASVSSGGVVFSDSYPVRILLVEDSPINQRVTQFMMRKLGYQIDVAHNGSSAVEKVLFNDYDLVLMDLQMPIMGGIESCLNIRKRVPFDKLPYICALTANVSFEDRLSCRDAKMNDFLAKPLCLDTLKQTIQKSYHFKHEKNISIKTLLDGSN